MLAMFCFCTLNLSNSFLSNCQFPFCQATQFCSAKQNIFARGGAKAPPAPPLGTPMVTYSYPTHLRLPPLDSQGPHLAISQVKLNFWWVFAWQNRIG